jgi:predicted RNA polymerase sigma factor
MDEQAALHVEDLLEKAEWIRSLARSLARDPDRADDLAQSTIALALERRPAEGVPRHRWFAAVMRKFPRQDLRWRRRETRARARRARRRFRRRASLGGSRCSGGSSRRCALEEPFRSTVLLRYLRD